MTTQDLRYALWNNKGGVGKTFLTFTIASEFARQHPDKQVVVVDMCPQANASEILLGGNGQGAMELGKLLGLSSRKTVGGYFDERITSPHKPTGNESAYLLHLSPVNRNLPENMYLVAGDPSLELQTQAMNQIAAQTLPASAWRSVHLWLKDLLEGIQQNLRDTVFFIDCNPSFSAYTEVALCAANRVIVPCTADGSSARAIDNMAQLLFGMGVPTKYGSASFSALANVHSVAVPSIHLVPLNRSTQYDRKASKAFGAMYKEIQERVLTLRQHSPGHFSLPSSQTPFMDIPDAHAVSVVASHEGTPLFNLRVGAHDIHGVKTQVNPGPRTRYLAAITDLVSLL